ncbi:DUF3080 family protein [Alteromonas sediminis]|uniref:DUF3080 family protein n=1 Tax=Alteromonas sediminis TaxID=2259342 RepID=UPI0014043135|nr:DUF3080 family protein [Alteromonas sediminis]
MALLIGLHGCGQRTGVDEVLHKYKSEISQIIRLPEVSASNVGFQRVSFPEKSQTKLTIPATEMNLRVFYRINSCPLAGIVAERNTALGKTHLPSQRFLYELRLLNTFDQCINQIEGQDTDTAARLLEWKAHKMSQFPLVWVNLVQQSGEIHAMLTRANGYFRMEDRDAYNDALTDIAYITSLRKLGANNTNSAERLEKRLQLLAKVRLPATLWRSYQLSIETLSAINSGLANTLASLDCSKQSVKADIARLSASYEHFYVNSLSPQLNEMQTIHERLDNHLSTWLEMPLNAAYSEVLQGKLNMAKTALQTAKNEHKMNWQALFAYCA